MRHPREAPTAMPGSQVGVMSASCKALGVEIQITRPTAWWWSTTRRLVSRSAVLLRRGLAMRQDRVWRSAKMVVLLVPMVMTLLWAGAGAASAATLTVCPSGCQYRQIGPAVAAARNGDTIQVGPGTYQGGITINVSVKLAGAGAGSTIIRGGDHVLTIGALGASREPVVSISGVTITGGLARSSPESVPYFKEEGVVAAGGGVEIPPQTVPKKGLPTNGATVTISDSVITGNTADPVRAVSPGPTGPPCTGGSCPIA